MASRRLLVLLLALVYLLGGTNLARAAAETFTPKKAASACCCCAAGTCGATCCCSSSKPKGPSVGRCGGDGSPATPVSGGPDHQSAPSARVVAEAPRALATFAPPTTDAVSALLDPPSKVPL